MAIAQVQDATLGKVASATTITTTFGATQPVAGNYIVVWSWGYNSDNPKVAGHYVCSDNATGGSNTYTQTGFTSIAGGLWVCSFYAKVVNTKSNLIVTVGNSPEAGGAMIAVATEFSGIASSSPADGAAVGTTGSSTSAAPGSKNYTSGSLVCCVLADNDGASASVIAPAGFTLPDSANNPVTDGSTYEVGAAAYAINPSSPGNPTWSIANVAWGTSQFALLSASAVVAAAPAIMGGGNEIAATIWESCGIS